MTKDTAHLAWIERIIRNRARLRFGINIVRLIFGAALCFLAALILGSMFWLAAVMMGWWMPWRWFFLGTAALTIPLLLRLELRTAARFLDEVVEGSTGGVAVDGALSVLALAGSVALHPAHLLILAQQNDVNPRAHVGGVVEMFLIGPRMVITAWRALRMALRLRQADVENAAEVILTLYDHGHGLMLTELQRIPGLSEPPVMTLAWLSHYGWIGVNEKLDRAWLLTQTRECIGPRRGDAGVSHA